jgi:hypothetical protein
MPTNADYKKDSYICERDVRAVIHINRLTASDLFDRCMAAAGWLPSARGSGFPSVEF